MSLTLIVAACSAYYLFLREEQYAFVAVIVTLGSPANGIEALCIYIYIYIYIYFPLSGSGQHFGCFNASHFVRIIPRELCSVFRIDMEPAMRIYRKPVECTLVVTAYRVRCRSSELSRPVAVDTFVGKSLSHDFTPLCKFSCRSGYG